MRLLLCQTLLSVILLPRADGVVAEAPAPPPMVAPGPPQISVGDFHTCACSSAGVLKCWGLNNYGQLGYGDTLNRGGSASTVGDGLPRVDLGSDRVCSSVTAGSYHTCVKLGGNPITIKCFGLNDHGQLGLGDTQTRGWAAGQMGDALPEVAIGTTSSYIRFLSLGWEHSCMMLGDGMVKCWGSSPANGQTQTHGSAEGQMGDALPFVNLGTGVTARNVYAGTNSQHTCVIDSNNLVKCWGTNNYGQLGYGDVANRGILSSQMGDALPYVDLGSGLIASQLTVSHSKTCARIPAGGKVKCWGEGQQWMLGTGDSLNRGDAPGQMGDLLPAIDLGTNFSATAGSLGVGFTILCALGSDTYLGVNSGIKCYGDGLYGKLGYGDTLDRLAGNPAMFGDNLPFVPLGLPIIYLEVGEFFVCTVLSGSGFPIKCWGQNRDGSLGLGDSLPRGDTAATLPQDLLAVELGVTFTTLPGPNDPTPQSTSSTTSSSPSTMSTPATGGTVPSVPTTLTTTITSTSTSDSSGTTPTTAASTDRSRSTETTTSTTATWSVLAGEFRFAADGTTVAEVQQACVVAVAETTQVAEQRIHCMVAEPTGRRRLLYLTGLQGRRLQSLWQVSFTVEVPEVHAVVVQEKLASIESQSGSAAEDFATALESALASSSGSSSVVTSTFQFVDFSKLEDDGGMAGLQIALAAAEASVLSLLLGGGNTQVSLIVDGYAAAAAKTSRAAILAAGSLELEADGEFSATVPASIFASLDQLGYAVDDIAIVAISAGPDSNSTTQLDGVQVEEVSARLNLNLFSGGGAALAVSDLIDPVTFTLNVADPGSTDCAVWDEDREVWSTEGLSKAEGSGELKCATTHLSFFAGVIRGISKTLDCSQVFLLTKEGFEGLKDRGWQDELETWFLWIVITLMLILLAVAAGLDMKRYLQQDWSNACFLVVPSDASQDAHEAEKGSVTCCVACIGFARESLAIAGEVVGSAFRDMLDELMGNLWDFFGDARSVCEGVLEAFGEVCSRDAAGAGLRGLAIAMMARVVQGSFQRAARLNATALAGVHANDDLDTAVEDAGLKAAQQEAGRIEAPAAKPALEPTTGSTTTPAETGGDISAPPVMMSETPSAREARLHKIRERGEQTLRSLHEKHTEQLSTELAKASTVRYLFLEMLRGWFRHGPVASVLVFSITTSSSLRALHLICDLLGALLVSTLFMASAGGIRSRRSPAECTKYDGIAEHIGRLVIIGVASAILAGLPITILSLFHRRRFVRVEGYGTKAWKKQLRKWLLMDVLGWILGLAYASFAALYVALFFANAVDDDRKEWLVSGGTSLFTDVLLVPLAALITPLLLTSLCILLLMLVLRKSRAEVDAWLREYQPQQKEGAADDDEEEDSVENNDEEERKLVEPAPLVQPAPPDKEPPTISAAEESGGMWAEESRNNPHKSKSTKSLRAVHPE